MFFINRILPEVDVENRRARSIGTVSLFCLTVLALSFFSACENPSGGDSDPKPLSAVTGLSPASGTVTANPTPQFSWTGVEGAAGYELQFADTEAGVPTAAAIAVAAVNYTPASALAEGVHYWRVRAVTEKTQSEWSAIYKITISMLAAVQGLSPADGSAFLEASTALSWEAVTGAHHYELQLAESTAGLDAATAITVNTTTYTPTQYPDHYWYWRVRAVPADGAAGPWSDSAALTMGWETVAPGGTAPAAATTTTDSTPLLNWTGIPGAVKYELQLVDSELALNSATPYETTAAEYVHATALPNNTTYYWRLRGVATIGGESKTTAWSSTSSFTVSWGSLGPADGIRYPRELTEITDLAGTYVLGDDIDMTGVAWTPLGPSSGNSFTGSFDGKGYTISNLTINNASSDYQGLFGYVGSTASIANIKLNAVSVTADQYVGALAGWVNGGAVTGCSATGTVSGNSFVGGLIGSYSGQMDSCSANCTVSGTERIGGLIGYVGGSTTIVADCYSEGSVAASTEIGGGLVGYSAGSIQKSLSKAAVTGNRYLGGLVGYNTYPIEESWASGSVVGSGDGIGGLVGYNSNYIRNSYAIGSVNGTNNAGGLIGQTNIGNGVHLIINSFAVGAVSGAGINGGLVAVMNVGVADDCFYDTQTTGQSTSARGTGKTTLEMKTKATFTNWDFVGEIANGTDDLWGMDTMAGTVNNGYPYLVNNPPR